jgi:hypothetical protein
VEDDYTFYRIIKLLDEEKKAIKLNFYDFNCIGINFNGLKFKQAKLKQIEAGLKYNGSLHYSYGAYALNLLIEMIAEGCVKPVTIARGLKIKLRGAYAGGRNEFIQEPKEGYELYSIDFNRMYYNCLKDKYLHGKILRSAVDDPHIPGFYHIKYESTNKKYPVLFLNNHTNTQNYFCNGIGEGIF